MRLTTLALVIGALYAAAAAAQQPPTPPEPAFVAEPAPSAEQDQAAAAQAQLADEPAPERVTDSGADAGLGAVALNPEPARITDEAIWADVGILDRLQRRLRALNEQGRSAHDYHFSKAQAWLDLARDEYSENDRSQIVGEAANQSLMLIMAMERGDAAIPMETPLVTGSARLREDLWRRAEEMKGHPGFACAQHLIAEYEVRLVQAGHEDWEMGWRHALGDVRAVEDKVRDAEVLLARCKPEQPRVATIETIELVTDRFITYSEFDLDDPTEDSTSELARLLDFISGMEAVVKVAVTGHTDALGADDYNRRLSLRRAEKVREMLVQRGLREDVIGVEGAGESQPVQFCDEDAIDDYLAFKSCLAPNRRVEISVDSYKRVTRQVEPGGKGAGVVDAVIQ